MNMKKLLSMILVVAILSTNLCAVASGFNPIGNLINMLMDKYDHNDEDEAALSSGAASDGSTEPGDNAYAILGIEYIPASDESAAHFLVCANTVEACSVQINFKNEDTGEVILSLTGDLPENMHSDTAKIGEDTAFTLPAYYVIEALLIRSSDSAFVGEPYLSGEHTARYVQSRSKTPLDFPGKQIVSYDEAGYAVLGDHVICIAGGASSTADGYSFAYNGSLAAGDILMLNVDGKDKPVKVSSVRSNGDGTLTVQPDANIVMADVYDHLQVNAYLQPVGAAGKSSAKISTTTLNPSVQTGPLTLEGSINFTVMLDIVFDKENKFYSTEYCSPQLSISNTKYCGYILVS